jgi:glucokinase
VVKRTLEALAQGGGTSALAATLHAQGEITARDIFAAAAAGDALADKIVADTAFYLAVGATNLMHGIDPDMVVFGGHAPAGEPFLRRIRQHVQQLAFPVPAEKTVICFARLGSDAGFIGAAGCGRLLYRRSGSRGTSRSS